MTGADNKRREKRRHEEAVDWLLRNRESPGEGRPADFDRWLDSDPANRRAYEQAEALLGDARTAILSDPDLAGFQPRPVRRTAKVAGVVVALAGLTTAFFAFDGPMWLRADVIAGRGELPVVNLADGSMMQLNAGSAAAFDFDAHGRVVTLLRGEAFFEVAPDPARPFVVEADDGRTVALGTAFNVRIGGDDRTQVTVVEHAVQVSAGSDKVDVAAGQETSYASDGELGTPHDADTAAALAWRRGMLVVDNATLDRVVAEISRHFHGRIVLVGFGLGERRVSGTFNISDPEAALSVLEKTLHLQIFRMGPVVLVR